jgi:hypothetical protein
MSFSRHGQIYQSDVLFRPRSGALAGSAPGFIVLTSLRPAIPRQVGLHQSPPPLHRLKVIFNPSAETVNHHPTRAGEFSTGEMRNFQPALTESNRRSPGAGGTHCPARMVRFRKSILSEATGHRSLHDGPLDYNSARRPCLSPQRERDWRTLRWRLAWPSQPAIE